MSHPASTYTRDTTRPASPVCLVTSVLPSTLAASAFASSAACHARHHAPRLARLLGHQRLAEHLSRLGLRLLRRLDDTHAALAPRILLEAPLAAPARA